MCTACNSARLSFQGAGSCCVEAGFDGGELTLNAGALLLCEYFERSSLIAGLQESFTDRRGPDRVEHPTPWRTLQPTPKRTRSELVSDPG